MDAPPPYETISREKCDQNPLTENVKIETPIILTAPSAPNIIMVSGDNQHQMSHQYVPELCSTGAPGYCTWCWFGFLCQLPASYFLGKRLGERRAFLKYGIAGMLNLLYCIIYTNTVNISIHEDSNNLLVISYIGAALPLN